MADNPDSSKQLPAKELCNKHGNPNPILGKGALGNQFSGMMFYTESDRETLVQTAQTMLETLGYSVGSAGADGIFGNDTQKAVEAFQNDHKDWDEEPLDVDGLIGPCTSDALNRAMVGIWYGAYQTPVELTQTTALLTVTAEALKDPVPLEIEDEGKARVVIVTPVPRPKEAVIVCVTWDGWIAAGARYAVAEEKGDIRGLDSQEASEYVTGDDGKVHSEHIPDGPFNLYVFPPERTETRIPDNLFRFCYKREGVKVEPTTENPDNQVFSVCYGEGQQIEGADSRKPQMTIVSTPGLLILTPSLGLPVTLHEDMLEILILTTQNLANLWQQEEGKGIFRELILSSLGYQPWANRDESYSKEALRIKESFARFSTLDAAGTGSISQQDPQQDLLGSLSNRVTAAYSPWHLDTLFRVRVTVEEADPSGYNLVNRQGEDLMLHFVLSDRDYEKVEIDGKTQYLDDVYKFPPQNDPGLQKPFFFIVPKWDKTAGFATPKGNPVRLLHPFFPTPEGETLGIAHITDIHVATRWDYFERILKNRFGGEAKFNNYNTRFSEILTRVSGDSACAIAVITGDLVDYNRGHDGTESNDFKENYLFNRNWLLFYELLISNYTKPIFTILGNHEYLPNPYPTLIEVEAKATDLPAVIPWFLFPLTILNPILVILGLCGLLKVNERIGFGTDLNLTLDQVDAICPQGSNERKPFAMTLVTEAQPLIEARKALDEPKIKELLEQKLNDELNKPTGIWYTHPETVTWYHLVVNPFHDYSSTIGNLSLLLLDWNEKSETGSLLILPRPINCPSNSQISLTEEWIRKTPNVQKRVLCSHAPIIHAIPKAGDRWLSQGLIKDEHDQIMTQDSDHAYSDTIMPATIPILSLPASEVWQRKMMYGIMGDTNRGNLLSILLQPGRYPVHLHLGGHTHANRIFQAGNENPPRSVRLHRQSEQFPLGPSHPPVFAVTVSGGPLGWFDEAAEWLELVPPGYRLYTVGDTLTITDQSHADPAIDITERVKDQANTELDWDVATLKPTEVMVRKTVPCHDISASHDFDPKSALIDEVTSDITIKDIQDHGDIVQMVVQEAKKTVLLKQIAQGRTITLENNDGTLVLLDLMGKIIINDNDDIISIDHNHSSGMVDIRQNDDDIQVRFNQGIVNIQNTTGSSSETDRNEVIVVRNEGTIEITSNSGGLVVRSNIYIYVNNRTVSVRGNDDQVSIWLNRGEVLIAHNDDEVFLQENQGTLVITGNHDEVIIEKNTGTIRLQERVDHVRVKNNQTGTITIAPGTRGILHLPPVGSPLRGTIQGSPGGELEIEGL